MRETMLIIHFIGLAMGLGTSIGFMFLGIAASKLEEKERAKFAVNTFSLSKMGQTGTVLLVISGLYLLMPFIGAIFTNHLLLTKLVLVIVLIVFLVLIARVTKKIKAGDFSQIKKLQSLGKMALLTALAIVVLAVLFFK